MLQSNSMPLILSIMLIIEKAKTIIVRIKITSNSMFNPPNICNNLVLLLLYLQDV